MAASNLSSRPAPDGPKRLFHSSNRSSKSRGACDLLRVKRSVTRADLTDAGLPPFVTAAPANGPTQSPSNRERGGRTGGRPSQRNRLMKHAVPDQWVKRALLSDVYLTAQFFFQIDQQPPGEPRWRTRTAIDQQIQVAVDRKST